MMILGHLGGIRIGYCDAEYGGYFEMANQQNQPQFNRSGVPRGLFE